MLKKKFFVRYFLLLAVFVCSIFVYGGTLLNMQIANAEEYIRKIPTTYTRTFVVPAVRGEIFDRNGIALVTNRNIYNIVIDGTKMPRKDYIAILIDLVEKINFYNGELEPDTLPVMSIENPGIQEISYSYRMMTLNEKSRLDRFLTKNKLNVNTSADELIAFLTAKYNIDNYMPPEERDRKLFRTILGICYDIDRLDVFAGSNIYKVSLDISKVLMAVIMENSHNYPGVEISLTYERIYHFPETASHIIGTIGKIPDGQQDWYTEKGYSLDAIVGRSGVEYAFEEYLRGTDGILERTYDQDNNLIDEQWWTDRLGNVREPVPGKNVYLTLDIKLQQVAEYSLEKTINRIHILARSYAQPRFNGADANAGAVAAITPNGEVLALATYPSYDITVFKDAERYSELIEDPDTPLVNRATQGRYAPGSVFKIATSVAGLCHGDIGPYSEIYDGTVYTKYRDYQPKCWSPYSHGSINVTQALMHSCNYFYYVLGERMQIDVLAEYARHLGLGVKTGVEIDETSGVLASPEYSESRGIPWTGGQLLGASIGQSYNLFSPLQMATMLGTVLNGGDRYKTTLLLCVKEYGSDEIYYAPEPTVLDSIEISEENLNAVRLGMRNVIELGTASGLFNTLPMKIGGKTGTAQVHIGQSSPNGTFVSFAPYDNPKIVISTVIEKGAKGTWAGFVSEDLLAYYFGYKSYEDSMDIEIEIEVEP